MRRITQAVALLKQRPGSHEVPDASAGLSVGEATQQLHRDIAPRFADFFDPLGQRQRQVMFRSDQMKYPLVME